MKKIAELRSLTVDALAETLVTLQKELRVLKASHVITPLKNPQRITKARKGIARIKTLLTQKSNAPAEAPKATTSKAAISSEKQPAQAAAPAASKTPAAKK